jgi:hypothetical protein
MAANTKIKVREGGSPRAVIGAFKDELGDLGKNAVKSFNKDFVEGSGRDFMSQLLGIVPGMSESPKPQAEHGPEANTDPTKGQVEIFSRAKHGGEKAPTPKKKESHGEAAINHGQEVRDANKKGMQREKQEQRSEIEQIKAELQQMKVKKIDIASIAINSTPKDHGKGTITFFRGILSSAKISEKQAADSGTWLKTGKQKEGFKANVAMSDEKSQKNSAG